jgi:cob(I)alamin adenosyltransferase
MKIYTKTGDAGETSLFSGGRVGKDHIRIEAYGTVDELSSILGHLRCEDLPDGVDSRLVQIQESLFAVGSALADRENRLPAAPGSWDSTILERWSDSMELELEPLRSFILPGGARAAAISHIARTVCRRAERRVISLRGAGEDVPDGLLPYLNRLSDALFTLARYVNAVSGIEETEWRPKTGD